MFYIEKRNRSKRWDFMLIHILPTLIVFFAFMGITLVSRESALKANHDQKIELLNRKTAEARNTINTRMAAKQDALKSAAGLMRTSDSINRTEWQDFLDSLDINNRFPSIQNIGYSKVLSPSAVAPFEATIRAEGFPNYSVRPPDPRSTYTAVQFIYPFEGKNVDALGADMFFDPTRKAAMELARDSSKATLTNKVILGRDAGSPQPSFIMYVPVYKRGSTTDTIEQRRQSIDGYVFAAFRARDLFGNLFRDIDKNYGVKIYDGGLPNEESLLYESDHFASISSQPDSEIHLEQLQVNNATWTIAVNEQQAALSTREQRRPIAILWLGLIFSILIAGLIYMLLIGRTRSLAFKDEISIQEAKDELLALASHQLRTPATGVKQYIGMLLEGYGGDVSNNQKNLLNKAYESNERQLNTINEMLFIARADAGEMKLDKEDINLNQMLQDIIAEHSATIHDKKQKLVTDILGKPIHIKADKRFMRMAVENIVNNATKYTPDGGTISISLNDAGNSVEIIISDDGVGVERKDFPLLFRKFSRIPNELTRKVSGSGIGLYLAKQVIDEHGGTIIFSSTVGKGSEFLIKVPKNSKKVRGG